MSNKPIPSDSIEDLKLNVLVEDEVVTSKDKERTRTRLGDEILTLHGMEKKHHRMMEKQKMDFSNFIASSGYDDLGPYRPGIYISVPTQGFSRQGAGNSGVFYSPDRDLPLPYLTTGDWEVEKDFFVVRGDNSLRQDLGNPFYGPSIMGYDEEIDYIQGSIGHGISKIPVRTEALVRQAQIAAEDSRGFAEVAGQVSSMRTFLTLQDAQNAMPLAEGLIQVVNDQTQSNNGYWASTGSSLTRSEFQPTTSKDLYRGLRGKADRINLYSGAIGTGILSIDGDATWLQIDPEHGGATQAVINYLKDALRLGEPGENYRVHPSDNSIVRSSADLSNFSLWGSSSAWYLAPLIANQVQSRYGASTYNGGVSGQGVESISARLGSRAADLIFPANVVPASGTVEVTSTTDFYRFINYTGVVAGVHGRLQRSVAGDPLRFTRTVSGESVSLSGPTPFIPDDGTAHRDSVTLLWMGKNDTSSTGDTASIVQKVVSYTDEAFNWLAPVNVRALVLGHFINYGSSAAARDQINQINAAHAKRYGPLFVDVQGWLMSPQVWVDLGITPTAQDILDQEDGVIASSLRRDNSHLNDPAYIGIFTFLIRPKIESELHWF